MARWSLLPECGTVPLRFESEREARAHLRVHYPDRRLSYKDDLGELYRLPDGFIHLWQEDGSNDDASVKKLGGSQ